MKKGGSFVQKGNESLSTTTSKSLGTETPIEEKAGEKPQVKPDDREAALAKARRANLYYDKGGGCNW